MAEQRLPLAFTPSPRALLLPTPGGRLRSLPPPHPPRRQAPVLKSESCSCMWPYLGPSENTEVPWGLPAFYPEAPDLIPCSWLDFFQGEHF